jgi:hypothetical protein
MSLRICLDKGNEPVTSVMHNSTDTLLASIFAVPVVVLQDDHRLFLALTRMRDVTSVKVAIVAAVAANRAEAILLG